MVPTAIALVLSLATLVGLNMARRLETIRARHEGERRESLAIVGVQLSAMERIALDWANWDEIYGFMGGLQPDFVAKNLETANLFKGVAMLGLLEPGGLPRLSYGVRGLNDPRSRPLIECARSNLNRLIESRRTVRVACRTGDGTLYLGVITGIHDGAGRLQPRGSLVYFERLQQKAFGPVINRQLQRLSRQLVWLPAEDLRSAPLDPLQIQPPIHGPQGQALALRRPPLLPELVPMVFNDLLWILGFALLLWAVRMQLVLDRRRQLLRKRQLERRSNRRIRRASQELDQLLAQLGMGFRETGNDQEVMARLIRPEESGALPPDADMEIKLELLADRFQHFLDRARSLALLDSLTKLPNRRFFVERLELEAERHRQTGQPFGILFVDIDKFKDINDTYGHSVGDGALVLVAQRLSQLIRPCDFLARYGGDEFAVLMDLSEGADQSRAALLGACESLALRISNGFGDAVTAEVEGHRLEIGLSIGAALVDPDDASVESAMRRSDVAMYRAKQARHGRVAIFDTGDGVTDLDTYALYGELMQAVREGALDVVFQPVVDGQGKIHSVEALARWHHPERGPIDPETFLGLAERHRQAMAVGEALIHHSLAGFAPLARAQPRLGLALNLAPSTLSDPALGEQLGPWLAEAGIAAERVTIELTERSVLEPTPTVLANLNRIRSLGMKLALDDFGTGYSSLNLLNSLKPDTVKIDQSFVRAMENDPYAHQIVSLIAGLNSRMNLDIVAEGVETLRSLELLQALGIDRFQGYYFSRPKTTAALLEELAVRPSTMVTPS
jgi:diguanylate cyclase (GGDEF)-like protein